MKLAVNQKNLNQKLNVFLVYHKSCNLFILKLLDIYPAGTIIIITSTIVANIKFQASKSIKKDKKNTIFIIRFKEEAYKYSSLDIPIPDLNNKLIIFFIKI